MNMSQPPNQPPRWPLWTALKRAPRVIVLGLLITAVFVAFGLRLWNLQFVQGERYRERADQQRLHLIEVAAPRGIIYDRNGVPLVRNVPRYSIVIVPAELPSEPEDEEQVLTRLADLLHVPYSTGDESGPDGEAPAPGLRELVDDVELAAYYRPLVVKSDVSRDEALLVAQEAPFLPGVSVQIERLREYPYGPTTAQLLGYLLPIPEEGKEEYVVLGYDPSEDRIGMAGVEATYEEMLRGQKGRRLVEEDVLGREVRVVDEQAVAIAGHNVYLTIDIDLQQFAEEALRRGMSLPQVNSPRGVVIVSNPKTGELLAMVSLPTYDNNLFARGISLKDLQQLSEDPHRPMINHAISDVLPPGSIFKVVVAAGALQEGVITERTQFLCQGTMSIPDKFAPEEAARAQPFYCWNRGGHGWLDVVGGLTQSCDIFFYKVGGGFQEEDFAGLGVTRIAQYSELFGLGEPTGVELPGDLGGLVPTSDWKRLTFGESWTTGDTYILSIGQGYLLATPLEMANVYNVVANGGTLLRPMIVHHVTDVQGASVQPFEPHVIHELPIDDHVWSVIQQGMEGAVAGGTAPRAQIEGVRVAGKTGTAQYCDNIAQELGICGEGLEQPTHAWFAAFAPVEDPQISVLVFVYNGGEGSTTAVPIAHEIMMHYFGLDQEEAAEGTTDDADGAVDEATATP
ncbi:MAG: penicillin-binding protein 2 [Anaerolineales bacterium]|nr:penicillin-binding protein 2 [Anaerolineales bacterium]